MAKRTKKKCRIKLNDILNDKLDSMEDSSVLDVFEPKNSAQLEFFDIVNKAIEEESSIVYTENMKKGHKNQKKKNVRVAEVLSEDMQKLPIGFLIILCSFFVVFVLIICKIIF